MLQAIRNKGRQMADQFIRLSTRISNRLAAGKTQDPADAKMPGALAAMAVGGIMVTIGGLGALFTPLAGIAILAAGKMTLAGGAATALLTGVYGAIALVGKGAIEKGDEVTGIFSESRQMRGALLGGMRDELKKALSRKPACEACQGFDASKTAAADFTAAADNAEKAAQQKPAAQQTAAQPLQNKR